MEWTPLEDAYERYTRLLEEAATEGLLQDPDDARKHGYPPELHLGDEEQEELGRFVYARTQEAFEQFNRQGGVHAAVLGQMMINVALAAMIWERERIG